MNTNSIGPDEVRELIQTMKGCMEAFNRVLAAGFEQGQTYAASSSSYIGAGVPKTYEVVEQKPPVPVVPPKPTTIGEIIKEIIAAKRNANRRERYVRTLEYYLLQFTSGREEQCITSFTHLEVEQWLSRYHCAYTRQTWLNRISTLFSFAVRRGYIASNPCDRIERISIDRRPPKILTVEEADKLLAVCPARVRPYLILALFAGIRPEEIERLEWQAVNLETATVKVDGKTRRRRIVPLEKRPVELLKAYPFKNCHVSPSHSTLVRWKHSARELLGLERFPQDLLRHTAASYLLALHGDAGKVATMLGNSSKILLTHYHEPVSEADSKAFWQIDN